jgi:hypothetical protein
MTKISALTAITTPLLTTDELAITRAGTSRKVSVLNLLGWTEVVKVADESLASNTTLQTDDELIFTAANGAIYDIDGTLIYGSPAGAGTPDLKIAFGEDATARGQIRSIGLNTTDAASGADMLANRTATATHGTAAVDRSLKFSGVYWGGGGTFAVMWAQGTSSASALIVRAGSILRYRRLK